jgi:peroxiredoxin (alkyl hydroperoxide reductase subunit C)
MKTVGYKVKKFSVVGVHPNGSFETITEKSFEGKWKIIVFYPKDFTFVCPTEILAYDKLNKDFLDRDAVLLIGSTDNEYCKLGWKNSHEGLKNMTSWMFADTKRTHYVYEDDGSVFGEKKEALVDQLGVFHKEAGAALRATFIVDPENVIQHVSVNNLDVGRNPDETLRILDALQTKELCQCNRQVGEKTLKDL